MLSKLVIGVSRSHRQSQVKSGLYVEGYNWFEKLIDQFGVKWLLSETKMVFVR